MGRRRHSLYQLSLFEEAELERCARDIRADIGLDAALDADAVMYLTELHGGAPIPDPCVASGAVTGEDIRANPDLPRDAFAVILAHELTHRLSLSARYEYLNPVRTVLPRRAWLEELAWRVVRAD